MPDDLYWQLTPVETGTLLDAIIERESRLERAATLRAGLVASAVYNVHRKKGTRMITPSFFLKKDSEPTVTLEPAAFRAALVAFADSHNKAIGVVH